MKLRYSNLYEHILSEYEKLSTCARLHVAALLVKDGRILSLGYNGVVSHDSHCKDLFKEEDGKFYFKKSIVADWNEVLEKNWRQMHHEFSDTNEIHAEMNCLMFALRNNIDISNCELIVSVSPCIMCAKLIVTSGIKKVYFKQVYDTSSEGLNFLKEHGVECKLLTDIEK